jgi:hypothetical protein
MTIIYSINDIGIFFFFYFTVKQSYYKIFMNFNKIYEKVHVLLVILGKHTFIDAKCNFSF